MDIIIENNGNIFPFYIITTTILSTIYYTIFCDFNNIIVSYRDMYLLTYDYPIIEIAFISACILFSIMFIILSYKISNIIELEYKKLKLEIKHRDTIITELLDKLEKGAKN